MGPQEVLQFFAGHHPRYPGASPDSLIGFSPADILETMDTAWLDTIGDNHGSGALNTLYFLIAGHVLDTLLVLYGSTPVVLALDAGHGGKPGVYYDPGSNGTEDGHNRRVVAAVEQLAVGVRYSGIVIRRIFNDEIGDDFALPPPEDRKDRAALTIRNARASMLAYEVNAWNRNQPAAALAVHVLSVHFNANADSILVLHQSDDVPAEYQSRSVAYARTYVDHTRPALIATGLLPRPLGLWDGSGLSDDHLLYTPPIRTTAVNPFTGTNRRSFPPRYAMLQGGLLERDYIQGALRYYHLD
ncbi:MAG: hypothetical protein ACR2PL_08940 [Dehalococcoidia bacterium]